MTSRPPNLGPRRSLASASRDTARESQRAKNPSFAIDCPTRGQGSPKERAIAETLHSRRLSTRKLARRRGTRRLSGWRHGRRVCCRSRYRPRARARKSLGRGEAGGRGKGCGASHGNALVKVAATVNDEFSQAISRSLGFLVIKSHCFPEHVARARS